MDPVSVIRRLKQGAGCPLPNVPVPGLEGGFGVLRPVRADPEDAAPMARWRTESFMSFFSWVRPDARDMLMWLKAYDTRDDDVIFMVEAPPGRPVGQMSLYHVDPVSMEAEFGRVAKGRTGPAGVMTRAAGVLIGWAFEELGLAKLRLDVFASNREAVALYGRLGFSVVDRHPYRPMDTDDRVVRWVPVARFGPGEARKDRYRDVCVMELDRDTVRIPHLADSSKSEGNSQEGSSR